MRWCGAILLPALLAMLSPCSVAADPVTEPLTVAAINDISLNPSILASSNSALTEGTFAGLIDPAKLGVIAVDSQVARVQVGAPSGYPPEKELADAILNGVPIIFSSGLLAESRAVSNLPLLDLQDPPASHDDDLEPTIVAPEPSNLLLLGTGFLGLALVLFRRARATEIPVSK